MLNVAMKCVATVRWGKSSLSSIKHHGQALKFHFTFIFETYILDSSLKPITISGYLSVTRPWLMGLWH